MKAVVAAFNQEKAQVGAFFTITNLRIELFEALVLLLTAAPFLIQIPVTAADTRAAPPRTPGSRAPGTALSREYSICINGRY